MFIYQLLFWLASGLIFYTFFGYLMIIDVLTHYVYNRVIQEPITPQVTLLIAAYNEEMVIHHKIENSLALSYPADLLDIVIVTDGSDDKTVQVVQGYQDQGIILSHQAERQGKLAAIQRVMPSITSEIVVFSDANTMLNAEAIRAIVCNFADPHVGAVAGEKQVLGGGDGLYWRYESFLKRCDSKLSSVMGAAGELFAIRRELFQAPEPDTILEDFVISLKLVATGWRVIYEPKAIAQEPPLTSLAGDWQRRVRNAAGGFQAMQRLPALFNPALGWVVWQYVSHRVLRWAGAPFLLIFVYLSNLLLLNHPFYRLTWIAQTVFYLLACIGYHLSRKGFQTGLLYVIFYFCFVNSAVIVGFWRYLTKTQPVTWVKTH